MALHSVCHWIDFDLILGKYNYWTDNLHNIEKNKKSKTLVIKLKVMITCL